MSSAVIPIMLLGIIVIGVLNKVKVFELFAEGVKEGLYTIFNLFPVFLGLFLAVSIFRASSLISVFSSIFEPILSFFKVPTELVGLVMLKPVSGSASLALFSEMVQEYGAMSYISFNAAIIMGTIETLMYAIAVYSGCVNKKMSYKVIILAIFGNIFSIILGTFFAKIFFNI